MILTGVFARDVGLIHGETHTFLVHLLGLAVVIGYVGIVSYILYRITNAIIPLRVTEEDERMGLDLSQHEESVSPH